MDSHYKRTMLPIIAFRLTTDCECKVHLKNIIIYSENVKWVDDVDDNNVIMIVTQWIKFMKW